MSSYGLWLSAAGMQIGGHRQTVLANNMANMNTPGFKQDLAVVRQRLTESREDSSGFRYTRPVLEGLSGGANVQPVYHSFVQGQVEHTGRPLDAAIQGEGFFAVSDGTDTRYTRDGAFTTNQQGELVLSAGQGRWKVLDDSGSAITLEPELGTPTIGADGTIRQQDAIVAKLGLSAAEDPLSLIKFGQNLFRAPEGQMQPMDGKLVSGAIERSNFEVMSGLASMIEASRAYQMNASLLQLQDQATGQAVTTVGRVA